VRKPIWLIGIAIAFAFVAFVSVAYADPFDLKADPGTVQNTTDDSFEADVIQNELPVVVDMFAEYCGPCKTQEPILSSIALDFRGRARVYRVDIEHNPKTRAKYGAGAIPRLLFFKDGKLLTAVTGLQTEETITRSVRAMLPQQDQQAFIPTKTDIVRPGASGLSAKTPAAAGGATAAGASPPAAVAKATPATADIMHGPDSGAAENVEFTRPGDAQRSPASAGGAVSEGLAISWNGDCLKAIKAFPSRARDDIDFAMDLLQKGKTPTFGRPVGAADQGLSEITSSDANGWYGLIYSPPVGNTIHVLNCFVKQSRDTSQKDIDDATARFSQVKTRQ
jgi:thioredoxin 1